MAEVAGTALGYDEQLAMVTYWKPATMAGICGDAARRRAGAQIINKAYHAVQRSFLVIRIYGWTTSAALGVVIRGWID